MPAPFKAAAIQFEPTMFRKGENIAALLLLVEEAAKAGAKLITTPEMATTGYCWHDREEVAPFVEEVPGATTDAFAEVAKKYGCYIVVGMPEVDATTGLYYNSAALIGPEGWIGTHRKTHLYISEPKWSASGNLGHQVFDTPIGRIAMLICMDIHFIETARLVKLGGADVICHISNWLAERTPAPYWINRAFENGCYLIESNRWGLERGVQFSGGSCIIAPDATILDVVDDGNGIAFAVVDPQAARKQTNNKERRPELYKGLMQETYLWNPNDFFSLYGYEPRPAGAVFQAAVGEFAPGAEIDENLAQIINLAAEARTHNARLLVLPEGALGETAVGATSKPIKKIIDLSGETGLCIVVGFLENCDGHIYNSALVVDRGNLCGIYRQTHLDPQLENKVQAGDEWLILNLDFARLGVLIGRDADFPEPGRLMALRGCDVIACPASNRNRFFYGHAGTAVAQPAPIPTSSDPFHWHQYRVRAGENNLYFLFSNARQHPDMPAASGIFGPDTFAFPRNEAIIDGADHLAFATLDTTNVESVYPTNIVRRKDLVLMRKPAQYEMLIRTGPLPEKGRFS